MWSSILGFGRDNDVLMSYQSVFLTPWQQASQGLKKDRSAKYEDNIIAKNKDTLKFLGDS
jgi:hypothetical protein